MAGHLHQVSNDIQILQLNNHRQIKNKTTTTRSNLVIELLDDVDDDKFNDDEDCVFLSSQKILTPLGNQTSPICVDRYPFFKVETELRTTIKSEKKCSMNIDSDSIQCVDDYDDENDEIRIITVRASPSPSLFSGKSSAAPNYKRRNPFSAPSVTQIGESSNHVQTEVVEIDPDPNPNPVLMMFVCEICADSKPLTESFKIKGCSHSYCFECMENYVASKLQDGISQINCPVPSCPGLLEPEYCREILPFEVFDRWGKLLCESVILASQKFYCPFKDCSALLIDDGGDVVTQSECPSCFRMFCAQCKVGWHQGIECQDYQKLSKDERENEDIMLRNLAKKKQWQRCPKCAFYVERVEGCLYMRCRCGTAFCYSCGRIHTDHKYHYCSQCGR